MKRGGALSSGIWAPDSAFGPSRLGVQRCRFEAMKLAKGGLQTRLGAHGAGTEGPGQVGRALRPEILHLAHAARSPTRAEGGETFCTPLFSQKVEGVIRSYQRPAMLRLMFLKNRHPQMIGLLSPSLPNGACQQYVGFRKGYILTKPPLQSFQSVCLVVFP